MDCYIELENVNDIDELSDELNELADDVSTIQDYIDEHKGDYLEKLIESLSSEGIELSCSESRDGVFECKYKFKNDIISGEAIFTLEIDATDEKIKDYELYKIRITTK